MPSIVPGSGKSFQGRGKLTRMGCERIALTLCEPPSAIEEALHFRESTVVGYPRDFQVSELRLGHPAQDCVLHVGISSVVGS
jgi:hypothetical protein